MSEGTTFSWKRITQLTDLLATVATVALVGVLVVMITKAKTNEPRPNLVDVPETKLEFDARLAEGSQSAKVVVIEYSDFQCPFCIKFATETLATIRRDYVETGKVRFAFRNAPGQGHAFAQPAAIATVCAARQGQFTKMHDGLFALKGQLSKQAIDEVSRTLAMDGDSYRNCLSDKSVEEAIDRDIADATRLRVEATPTFLFGILDADGTAKIVKKLTGAKPAADLAKIIEGVLVR